jgi:hypothetical protein
MIHYTPEGHHIKLGLNFSRTSGGFRLLWAWYDFATNTATTYRLRVRLHMAPRILWETKKWNVIDNYMQVRGLEMVSTEIIQDLYKSEKTLKRISDSEVFIKSV